MTRNIPTQQTRSVIENEEHITIHTDNLFDPKRKAFRNNISITVSQKSGNIVKVFERKDELTALSSTDIDLRGKTILPGLVDAHTHIFLHAYSGTPSINQERDESIVERTIRATNHCRAALLAGYTTYRDLGTESAQDADVHVRNAVNRGIIPGPRIFCATEALASSAGYDIRIESGINGVRLPRLSDPCDGVVGVKAGVRRRLGAGADVIKFYACYGKRALRFPPPVHLGGRDILHPPDTIPRNPDHLQFDQEEMNAIVAEARAARAPVAAHAQSAESAIMAAKAGVTTIEHGVEESDEAIAMMKQNGTIFVPTLAVQELFRPKSEVFVQTKKAHAAGVKLACGGDTGAFAHGENVKELELMLEAGVPLEEVFVAATVHGWEACGKEWCGRRFGWWEEGCAADIIALEGDVRKNSGSLRKVYFVMKDAKVWKQNGKAVGMI